MLAGTGRGGTERKRERERGRKGERASQSEHPRSIDEEMKFFKMVRSMLGRMAVRCGPVIDFDGNESAAPPRGNSDGTYVAVCRDENEEWEMWWTHSAY